MNPHINDNVFSFVENNESNIDKLQKDIKVEDVDKNDDEDDIDDDEFKCKECSTVQGLNNCELCDKENICEECYGQGGDYGPNEIWVCNDCLPTCLVCNSKLYTVHDTCCGNGRSDMTDEDDNDNLVVCEECNKHVDCYKYNIHILYKGESNNISEELVLCTMCFQEMEDDLIQKDYKCDEWDDNYDTE